MARVLSYDERDTALRNISAELTRLVQGHKNLSELVDKYRKDGLAEVYVETFASNRLTELEDLCEQIETELSSIPWIHQVTLQVGAPEQFKFAQLLNTYDNQAGKRDYYGIASSSGNMCRIIIDRGEAGLVFEADPMLLLSVFDDGDTVEIVDCEDKENKRLHVLANNSLPEHVKDASCSVEASWTVGTNWVHGSGIFSNTTGGGTVDDLLTPDLDFVLEKGRCYKCVVTCTLSNAQLALLLFKDAVGDPATSVYAIHYITATETFYFQAPFDTTVPSILCLLAGSPVSGVITNLSIKAIDTLIITGLTEADGSGTTEEDTHLIAVQNTEDTKLKLVLKDR